MAQAGGRCSFTAEVPVRSQTDVRGTVFLSGKVAVGQRFPRVLQLFAVSFMPSCSILVYHHRLFMLCIT